MRAHDAIRSDFEIVKAVLDAAAIGEKLRTADARALVNDRKADDIRADSVAAGSSSSQMQDWAHARLTISGQASVPR